MTAQARLVEALQEALRREHAAVYGYGVVGAHLRGAERKKAAAHLDAHRATREQLEALVRARDAAPVQPSASYRLPFRVTDAATAHRLAIRLERASLGAHVALVGAATRSVRRRAIVAMQQAAARQAHWSRDIDPLPGLRT